MLFKIVNFAFTTHSKESIVIFIPVSTSSFYTKVKNLFVCLELDM